jgi:hypothetical protein
MASLKIPPFYLSKKKFLIRNGQNSDSCDGEEKNGCFCQEMNLGHPPCTSPLTFTGMIDRADFIEG